MILLHDDGVVDQDADKCNVDGDECNNEDGYDYGDQCDDTYGCSLGTKALFNGYSFYNIHGGVKDV